MKHGYPLNMLMSTTRPIAMLCLVVTLALALVCSFLAQARAHGFESTFASHSHAATVGDENVTPSQILADDPGHRHGKSHNPADHSHEVPALPQLIDHVVADEATKLRSWFDQALHDDAVSRLERPPRA